MYGNQNVSSKKWANKKLFLKCFINLKLKFYRKWDFRKTSAMIVTIIMITHYYDLIKI